MQLNFKSAFVWQEARKLLSNNGSCFRQISPDDVFKRTNIRIKEINLEKRRLENNYVATVSVAHMSVGS